MPLQIQQLNYHYVLIEFDSKVDVEWVAQKLLRVEWWVAPCHLKCVPCSDEEGFQQFRGGEWVAPRVDPEWIDLSSQGHQPPWDVWGGPILITIRFLSS